MGRTVIYRLSVLVACSVILVSFVAQQANGALASGDGILVYGEGSVTTPRYRTWTQGTSTWGSELSAQTAASTIRHTRIVSSPSTEEMIMGVFKETVLGTNMLYVQRWDGSAWNAEWNVDLGNAHALPTFDIAYEQNSGHAMVMYGTGANTTNELAYRIWDGSSWGSAVNYDAQRTAAFVGGVKLEAKSESDALAVVWVDNANDLSANYWDGSAWTGEPSAALTANVARLGTLATTPSSHSFDVAFEDASGDVLVAWGVQGTTTMSYATRSSGGGGTWSGVTVSTDFGNPQGDLELASEPDSNYIAYAGQGANTIGGSIWDGSSWATPVTAVDTSTNDAAGAGTKNLAVAWVASGAQSRAIVTYDDSSAAGVDWFYYNKNTDTWSATQTDFTGTPTPVAANDRMQRMYRNPASGNEALLFLVDNNSDLFAKKLVFDGTNLTWSSTEPGGVVLDANVSSNTGMAADFAYYLEPGVLWADIVNSSGASVASPSADMSNTSVSLDCQVVAGTLGVSEQRIRIGNDTPAPAWTLSVAATSGATSLWSNGTTDYDFNDSGGTPAGCSDSGDADSRAGQLTVDPSVSTVTPEAGCSTTGVTKGGSAAFAQGTIDNITLLSASSSADPYCYFDMTGIGLSQRIPAGQPTGSYTLNVTLTITAN